MADLIDDAKLSTLGWTAFITGGLIALLCVFEPPDKHWWDVLGMIVQAVAAVGTLGAAVIALALGRRSSNESKRKEDEAAAIVAAGLVGLLEPAIFHLKNATASMAFFIPTSVVDFSMGGTRQDAVVKRLRNALSAPAFDHGFDTLSRLAPLPYSCAVRLYRARSLVRALQHDVEMSVKSEWSAMPTNERQIRVRDWLAQTLKAIECLEVVTPVLRKAAQDAGMEIQMEELYPYDDDADE